VNWQAPFTQVPVALGALQVVPVVLQLPWPSQTPPDSQEVPDEQGLPAGSGAYSHLPSLQVPGLV
jgi:hypothetical protein